MKVPKYFIVETTEEIGKISWNSRVYAKGVRVMVWEDKNLDCYWTVNTNDNFKTHCAKKLYEFDGKEL
jgi:hypothetical protein